MTKTTKKLDIEETVNEEVGKPEAVSPRINEVSEVTQVEKAPPGKRTKKDRSPAQIAAFEKMLRMRRSKAELQLIARDKRDQEKRELEDEADEIIEQERVVKKKPRRKIKRPIIVKEESSSEEEPQVIYVKKRRKPTRQVKKSRKVIYEDSSSSGEEEEVDKPTRRPKRIEKGDGEEKVRADKPDEYKNVNQSHPLNPANCKAMNKLLLMRSMGF